MALAKATLTEITGERNGEPQLGAAVAVQFNPASLKLSLANQVDPQQSHGQQRRQFLGASSTTLAFDLVFDTADEGTTESPVSVRSRTAMVERFLLPRDDNPSPPRVRFEWSELRLDGVIESLTIDFELFASDGTPLRAKMSVTIKEQNRKYQAAQLGPAARSARNAPVPGRGGAGPGAGPGAAADASALPAGPGTRSEPALAGEAAAQFAARVGLDPAAWRSVAGGVENPLAILGGAEVSFDRNAGARGAIGVRAGVTAGVGASLEQEFGVDPDGSVPTPDGVALGPRGSSGFRLAAAGGLGPALDRVTKQRTDAAAAAARSSFGPSVATPAAPPATDAPGAPPQAHTPLRITGLPGPTAARRASAAPPLPGPDPRAATFGLGVPLRDRVPVAAASLEGARAGGIRLRPDEWPHGPGAPARVPGTAPWISLPDGTAAASREETSRRPPAGCACRPGC